MAPTWLPQLPRQLQDWEPARSKAGNLREPAETEKVLIVMIKTRPEFGTHAYWFGFTISSEPLAVALSKEIVPTITL